MGFVTLENPRGLAGMGSGADVQVELRRRYAQIAEEHLTHRRVVVLAGVNDSSYQPARCPDRAHDRREFHEVRARAGHQINDFSHYSPARGSGGNRTRRTEITPGVACTLAGSTRLYLT